MGNEDEKCVSVVGNCDLYNFYFRCLVVMWKCKWKVYCVFQCLFSNVEVEKLTTKLTIK